MLRWLTKGIIVSLTCVSNYFNHALKLTYLLLVTALLLYFYSESLFVEDEAASIPGAAPVPAAATSCCPTESTYR